MHFVKPELILLSFYKFTKIENLIDLKNNIRELNKKNSFFGTILVSAEGVNGSICSSYENIQIFRHFIMKKISPDFSMKMQLVFEVPFKKFRVKIKNQIIKIGEKNFNPENGTGRYLNPNEWDEFLKNKNSLVIDTRNSYESNIGYFKDSIFPMTASFSEFPEWFKKNCKNFRSKNILTYCTGGIRCEKATSYIKSIGFDKVFQLRGGILNYFTYVDMAKSNFQGECFVFDERVSVNHSLKKGSFSVCYACGNPLTKNDLMSSLYNKGISCPNCYFKTTSQQKKKFENRQKQFQFKKLI